jgi:hypothetical protein
MHGVVILLPERDLSNRYRSVRPPSFGMAGQLAMLAHQLVGAWRRRQRAGRIAAPT